MGDTWGCFLTFGLLQVGFAGRLLSVIGQNEINAEFTSRLADFRDSTLASLQSIFTGRLATQLV
jgi:hypothetical protein